VIDQIISEALKVGIPGTAISGLLKRIDFVPGVVDVDSFISFYLSPQIDLCSRKSLTFLLKSYQQSVVNQSKNSEPKLG